MQKYVEMPTKIDNNEKCKKRKNSGHNNRKERSSDYGNGS